MWALGIGLTVQLSSPSVKVQLEPKVSLCNSTVYKRENICNKVFLNGPKYLNMHEGSKHGGLTGGVTNGCGASSTVTTMVELSECSKTSHAEVNTYLKGQVLANNDSSRGRPAICDRRCGKNLEMPMVSHVTNWLGLSCRPSTRANMFSPSKLLS